MPAPAAPKTEMRVFQLKYVKAGDLAQTMQQIWRQRLGPGFSVGVDFRSNSVIVTAGSQDMAMLDALISKLDAASSQPADKIRVFSLSHTRADPGLNNALGLVLAKGTFQVDPSRNQVIVSGDEKSLAAAEMLLSYLDTPQNKPNVAGMQVRLVWLASGPTQKEARKPPEDMKAVVAELAKMGIEETRLVAQTLIAAMPDSQFRVEGLTELDTAPYRLSVSGKLEGIPGEPTKRLQISILATQAPSGPMPGGPSHGRLDTEITTLPGHFVVLGMTPTATSTSVFVVQILPKK